MKTPAHLLLGVFLVLIFGVPILQLGMDVRNASQPAEFELFQRWPDSTYLRAFEHRLQERSVTVRCLRPWMQAFQFFVLRDAGAKVLRGRDGWLFYQPGLSAKTLRPAAGECGVREAIAAVSRFRSDLAARGIRLIVVPVPDKESIYPESLGSGAPGRLGGGGMKDFFDGCRNEGVETVNLFDLYRVTQKLQTERFFLKQDSHWSPAGLELAARAVAGRIGSAKTTAFSSRKVTLARHGDLVQMLHSSIVERFFNPECIQVAQIYLGDTGTIYMDDNASDVLVLGDSFLRIFEQDEPGGAGFTAHLAGQIGRPVASIVNDGGGSTLVRQEFARHARQLKQTRVVVWEFVERDIRLGIEGWQIVPLESD